MAVMEVTAEYHTVPAAAEAAAVMVAMEVTAAEAAAEAAAMAAMEVTAVQEVVYTLRLLAVAEAAVMATEVMEHQLAQAERCKGIQQATGNSAAEAAELLTTIRANVLATAAQASA